MSRSFCLRSVVAFLSVLSASAVLERQAHAEAPKRGIAAPQERPPSKSFGLKFFQASTLVLTGFQTGNYLGTALWYSSTKKKLDFPSYVDVQGSPNGLNSTTVPWEPLLAPLTVGVNVVPLALIGFRNYQKPSFIAHAIGTLLNIGVVVPMLGWKAPISAQTRTWTRTQTPPADWTQLRDQWETANLVQGLFSLGALIANTTGTLLD